MSEYDELRRYFDDAYERLAEEGACDLPGGAEYKRVLAEWFAANRPSLVEDFIRRRANWIPTVMMEKETPP